MIKKLGLLILLIFSYNNILSGQSKTGGELSLSFEYEFYPYQIYSLERLDKFENGGWISEKQLQNKLIFINTLLSIKAEILFPIVDNTVFNGFLLKFSLPTKKNTHEYSIPFLDNNFSGDVTMPNEYSVGEYFDQKIKNEYEIMLFSLFYRLDVKIILYKNCFLNIGFGVGPEIVFLNKKNTIERIYQYQIGYFNKGESAIDIKKENNIYIIPKGEIITGVYIKVAQNINLGIYAKYGLIFINNFLDEKTDYYQTEWWPADKKLTKMSFGNIFQGNNIGLGITLKYVL